MKMLQRIWKDEAGFVVSAELILVATIAVIGMVVGLNAVKTSVTAELADVAAAIGSVSQSYTVWGAQGHSASVAGFEFGDAVDFCDVEGSENEFSQCVAVSGATVVGDESGAIAAPSGPNTP
jgi:Flp pilus assembly pilin Flp